MGDSCDTDRDGDHAPACAAADDDADGQPDADEEACGSAPRDANSRAPDFDGDSLLDCFDADDDGGCNASQIADAKGLGTSHYNHGVSPGVLNAWIKSDP